MTLLDDRWDKPPEGPFTLDYWKVAAALCRAVEEIAVHHGVDRDVLVANLTIELEREYPNLGWANVMTDSWPLSAVISSL